MRARRAFTSVLALALLTSLAGCGGDDEPRFAAAVSPAPLYDVYFSAVDAAGTGGSELYGLNLNPLRAHRLTVGAGAFSPTAHGDQVIVEDAADGAGLGLLQPDGTVGDIPGLGRPVGDDPQLLPDGRIRWSDTKKGVHRFLEWNPAAGRKKVLDQVASSRYVEFASGPGDGWLRAEEVKKGTFRLSVVTAKKTWTHKLPGMPLHVSAGRDRIVVVVENDPTETSDYLLLILHPSRGKLNELADMHPVAWSPGGRRLLAVPEAFGGNPQELFEVWFSGGGVARRPVGMLPAMQVGEGTWRTGIPVPMCKDCAEQPTLEKDY